jgi:hypothetical protein
VSKHVEEHKPPIIGAPPRREEVHYIILKTPESTSKEGGCSSMCMKVSGEDIVLYDEARKAYRAKDLGKLRSVYERLIEINASQEIVFIVSKMIDELEKKLATAKV